MQCCCERSQHETFQRLSPQVSCHSVLSSRREACFHASLPCRLPSFPRALPSMVSRLDVDCLVVLWFPSNAVLACTLRIMVFFCRTPLPRLCHDSGFRKPALSVNATRGECAPLCMTPSTNQYSLSKRFLLQTEVGTTDSRACVCSASRTALVEGWSRRSRCSRNAMRLR